MICLSMKLLLIAVDKVCHVVQLISTILFDKVSNPNDTISSLGISYI